VAIADDAAYTIERTAINPVVNETHDCGTAILDAEGNLVAGGGRNTFHWVSMTQIVRAVIERYGDHVDDGDVFFANDPYNGGGLHPNDAVVARPVVVAGNVVAWATSTAHLMDVGGITMGSFSPMATDCYQEGLRVPPTHLLRRGDDVREFWELYRTNTRRSQFDEMDIRAMVAGSFVAAQKLRELIDSAGVPFFLEGLRALQDLSERELRARIRLLADGEYRATTWFEWDMELYELPCVLTIDDARMIFDFEGAAPQAPHYFNCRPHVLMSVFIYGMHPILTPDLPFTQGLCRPIELRCPEGSVMNPTPPAPLAGGHFYGATTACDVMLHCLNLAGWAALDQRYGGRFVFSRDAWASVTMAHWTGVRPGNRRDTWLMLDTIYRGGPARDDTDGVDVVASAIGRGLGADSVDVEIIESLMPMMVLERGLVEGQGGVGRYRSGSGRRLRFTPYDGGTLHGHMLGTRRWLVGEGGAGGFPGTAAAYLLTRAGAGQPEEYSNVASGVVLAEGDQFELRSGSAGGFGDPTDRHPETVAADVVAGDLHATDARNLFGVVIVDGRLDADATKAERSIIRQRRLSEARPARTPVADSSAIVETSQQETYPLYPGVVQIGEKAVAVESGVVLAVAPDHWTDGCPVLEWSMPGPDDGIVVRAYLDPSTGKSLYVEVTPPGVGRSFATLPRRWTTAVVPATA
jgi:N-methylhydantoinase B